MNMKEIAEADSPQPSRQWIEMSSVERISKVRNATPEFNSLIELINARENGYLIARLIMELDPKERGNMLMNYEFQLKEKVDPSITVWLEPLGDKSTLRRLRGMEVKK